MTNEESIQDVKIQHYNWENKGIHQQYDNTVIPWYFFTAWTIPSAVMYQPTTITTSCHFAVILINMLYKASRPNEEITRGISAFYLDIKANTLNFGVDSIGHRLDWDRKWYIIPYQEATSNHAWHKSSKHKSTRSHCLVLSPSRAKMTISMRRRLPDGTTVIPRQALKHQ